MEFPAEFRFLMEFLIAMAKFGYVRVSSDGQNTERQLADLTLDRLFVDHASGKDTNRPELQNLLTHLRNGDEIYVHSMDRLARNLQDLLRLVEKITSAQATLVFVKENLTFSPDKESSPMAVLLLQLLGAVAQFERSLIKERQREGIEKAKARGAYKGRVPIDEAKLKEAIRLCETGTSVVKAAKYLGIGKSTLYNYIAKAKSERA